MLRKLKRKIMRKKMKKIEIKIVKIEEKAKCPFCEEEIEIIKDNEIEIGYYISGGCKHLVGEWEEESGIYAEFAKIPGDQ